MKDGPGVVDLPPAPYSRDPGTAQFASSVVHALRTPLCALSGEVELALRRPRSCAEYQETLARVELRVAELVDMTADLGFLAQLQDLSPTGGSVSLEAVCARLGERFGARRGHPVLFAAESVPASVGGEERLLIGALALLLECAVGHRRTGVPVRVLAMAEVERATGRALDERWAEVRIEAPGANFAQCSSGPGGGTSARQVAFDAAVRIIEACGGSVHVSAPACDTIGVRLRRTVAPEPGPQGPTRMRT